MATDDRVEIEGLAALIKALRAAEVELDDLKQANQAAGSVVLDASRPRAPQRTGALAASGRASRAARKATVVFGRASVPYANPIHWGWRARNIKPQPFVTEAVAATREDWLGAYERDIERVLSSIEGST